jgi:hypothetical protein
MVVYTTYAYEIDTDAHTRDIGLSRGRNPHVRTLGIGLLEKWCRIVGADRVRGAGHTGDAGGHADSYGIACKYACTYCAATFALIFLEVIVIVV